jgi:vancomycin resistance protein VanJ
MRRLTQILIAGCNLYGLTLTVLLILRFLIGERPIINGVYSPVGMLNSMFVIALLPALLTLLLCLLLRRPQSAALQLLPVVMLFVTYGGNFLPRTSTVSAQGEAISVLSYNLLYTNARYDQIIEIIQNADADVVALQELNEEGSAILSDEFRAQYPYQALYPVNRYAVGGGILSRYPIADEEAWEDVMMQQRVVIEVNDEPITLFNVHPPVPVLYGANVTLRSEVIGHILAEVSEVEGRVLLIGDFNMGDVSEDYERVIDMGFTDAFRAAGYGFGLSFPDWTWRGGVYRFMPTLSRIDYIFYSEEFEAVEAWTSHTSGSSDHRPVYARLVFE